MIRLIGLGCRVFHACSLTSFVTMTMAKLWLGTKKACTCGIQLAGLGQLSHAASNSLRPAFGSVMEYKTARVAVFYSRTLGIFRLLALIFVFLFIVVRVLLDNVGHCGVFVRLALCR